MSQAVYKDGKLGEIFKADSLEKLQPVIEKWLSSPQVDHVRVFKDDGEHNKVPLEDIKLKELDNRVEEKLDKILAKREIIKEYDNLKNNKLKGIKF